MLAGFLNNNNGNGNNMNPTLIKEWIPLKTGSGRTLRGDHCNNRRNVNVMLKRSVRNSWQEPFYVYFVSEK
jgi:hypothetical protein